MLLFVLDPYQRPAQPPPPPSIKFLKSRHCRDKPPLVPGSTEKVTNIGQSRVDPASFLFRNLTPTPNPGSSLSTYQSRLSCGAALCGAEAPRLYPIATHSCMHIAKSFISASDTGIVSQLASTTLFPFPPGQVTISFHFGLIRVSSEGAFDALSPHLLFNRNHSMRSSCRTPICVLRCTWLWRERSSRVLRGCCAAAVPISIRSRAAIVSLSIQPRSRKQ
jgi:hypothetical protein